MNIESIGAYLFVTDEDSHPEWVKSEVDTVWSCSKNTRENDIAFVYVKGKGIVYQWRVASNASVPADSPWPYVCEVEHTRTFEPPISLDEIKSAVKQEVWSPPHQNFRGYSSIIVPIEAALVIYDLR